MNNPRNRMPAPIVTLYIRVMDPNETIRELERRFLPALRAAAAEINAGFAGVRAGTWSQPHGQATDSPGHAIALSCEVHDQGHPSEVTLELCFGALQGPSPSVEAHVVWDYPGQVEADLSPDSIAMTENTLRRIEEELPRLVEVLRTAVRRGRPSR